jgi:hypothetical protein
MAAWARLSIAVATTLASSSTPPRQHGESCASLTSLQAACAASDAHVSLVHSLAPLALAAGVTLWSYLPTLVLSSRRRAHRLSVAAANVAAVWGAAALVAAAHFEVSRSLGYALSLHLAVTLLSSRKSDALLLFSPAALAAARALAVVGVAVAAGAGPPLPVVDAPGVPGCCGATSHLAAWAAAETLGAGALCLALDLRAEL